ncbi:hypothetical protein NHQ30_011175 [Ciborinia camelliae]|nr:hypothetical protein NHQ30_011175 [Ciborinia camelliae]
MRVHWITPDVELEAQVFRYETRRKNDMFDAQKVHRKPSALGPETRVVESVSSSESFFGKEGRECFEKVFVFQIAPSKIENILAREICMRAIVTEAILCFITNQFARSSTQLETNLRGFGVAENKPPFRYVDGYDARSGILEKIVYHELYLDRKFGEFMEGWMLLKPLFPVMYSQDGDELGVRECD